MTAPRRAATARRSKANKAAAAPSIDELTRPRGQPELPLAPPPRTPADQAESPAPPVDPAVFDGQYRIKLESFEGPLDLLLHLIQQHELDILDIPVSFITSKYLEYLKLMQVLSIEIASEYLVMAATLVHIKSKMLLPVAPSGQDDGMPQEEEEDPRAELVRRLLEYQKYKAAAAELAERGTLGRDIFPRGMEEAEVPGPAEFAKVEVFDLLGAFEKILKRTKVRIDHEVVFDRISITDRILELTDKLSGRRAVRFEWLFLDSKAKGPTSRFDLVITFLAMLEMCRMKLMRVYQTGPLAPIYMGLIEGQEELSEEDRALADRAAEETLAEHPEVEEPAAEEEAREPTNPADPETGAVQLELPYEADPESPAIAEDMPAAAEDMPAAAEDMPAVAEDMPAVTEETAAATEDIPAAAEETAAAAEDIPAAAEETSAAAEDMPAVAEETSAAAEDVPAVAEEMPTADLADLNLAERGDVSFGEDLGEGTESAVETPSEEVPDDG